MFKIGFEAMSAAKKRIVAGDDEGGFAVARAVREHANEDESGDSGDETEDAFDDDSDGDGGDGTVAAASGASAVGAHGGDSVRAARAALARVDVKPFENRGMNLKRKIEKEVKHTAGRRVVGEWEGGNLARKPC